MTTTLEPQATPTRPLEGEQRVLLRDVGWEGYDTLLRVIGDGHVRVTYDGGNAELMSPSLAHEDFKTLIARFIETITVELDIPCQGAGSATWRNQALDRGLEPDECYFLANAERVIGRQADPNLELVPDLAVEIEIRPSALDRLSIYAALGIPEVWRFDGRALVIECLRASGSHENVAKSPALPFLTASEVTQWIHRGQAMGQTPWARQLRDWARDDLSRRRERPNA